MPFSKTAKRELSDTYTNIAITVLDFLLISVKNYKKDTISDNLRTITQEGNMKTRQMTPFLKSTFPALFRKLIFAFEICQNSFSQGPLWSILVWKIPQFRR